MADLLLGWVNDEIGLHKHVSNLGPAWSTGYLIGELLNKHNQQSNLGSFQRKDTPDAKINNFCLLEPTIRRLNIKFDSKVAFAIMQGDTGQTSKLLYQLKMAMDRLEKFSAPVSIREAKPGMGTRKALPNVPVRPSHSKVNEKNHEMFEKNLRIILEGGNDVMTRKTLKRFKDEEEKQLRDLEQFKVDTNNAAVQKILDIKAVRMNQKKEEAKRLSAQQQETMETWENNQAKARERKNVKMRVTKKLQRMKEDTLSGMKLTDQHTVVDQIRDFEVRLSKLDNPPPVSGASRTTNNDPNAAVSDKRGMERDVANQMKSITDRKKLATEKSIAREKRKRRFLKSQEEAEIEGFHVLGVEMIKDQLTRKTVSERKVEYDISEISKHKAMAVENRAYRNLQYKQRAEVDSEVSGDRSRRSEATTLLPKPCVCE